MSDVTEIDYTATHIKVPIIEEWDQGDAYTFKVHSFSLNYLADGATVGQLYAAVGRWIDAQRKEIGGRFYIHSVYGAGDHLNVVYKIALEGRGPFVVAAEVPSPPDGDSPPATSAN